jgi:hypothetical protein
MISARRNGWLLLSRHVIRVSQAAGTMFARRPPAHFAVQAPPVRRVGLFPARKSTGTELTQRRKQFGRAGSVTSWPSPFETQE